MTFIEFAENVLGIELLDWQKVVLEKAQECKDDGKSFYIRTDARAAKALLANVYQQKLGYDRGFKNGYQNAVEDIIDLFGCSDEDICAKETIREWLNNKEKVNENT